MNKEKILIVGLGIGSLYVNVLSEEFDIETYDVDETKTPTYTNINDIKNLYDMAIICTPNFTHESIARHLLSNNMKAGAAVLIEKPGVSTEKAWETLVNDHPNHRIYMVKNNMYRSQISQLSDMIRYQEVESVEIVWHNKNRIPSPGSWFTTKEKSFGGVSKDLMPHCLSFVYSFTDNLAMRILSKKKSQNYELVEIDSTDYGTVNKNGVYDVDDYCKITLIDDTTGVKFECNAAWKSPVEKRMITIYMKDGSKFEYDFGLCPESAYKEMVKTIMYSEESYEFHKKLDLIIHRITE